MDTRKVLNGTNGKVVLDGDELTNATAFQAKLEFELEEMNFLGDLATYNDIVGYKGTGSIKLRKTDSKLIKKVGEAIRKGITPIFTIIGEVKNKNTGQAERIALLDIIFTDLTLFDFESKKGMEQECPFVFSKFVPYDLI